MPIPLNNYIDFSLGGAGPNRGRGVEHFVPPGGPSVYQLAQVPGAPTHQERRRLGRIGEPFRIHREEPGAHQRIEQGLEFVGMDTQGRRAVNTSSWTPASTAKAGRAALRSCCTSMRPDAAVVIPPHLSGGNLWVLTPYFPVEQPSMVRTVS
jgi:hypothetical protein